MKYLIVSDIHGSSAYFKQVLEYYKNNNCDKLLILGDVLYHGPRNNLPDGFNVKELMDLLNNMAKDIICVKGNCDAEVDEMVLDFPLVPNVYLHDEDRTILLTHGHHISPTSPIKLKENSLVLYGHTHVYKFEKIDGVYYFNPGSISLPKVNKEHTFALYEGGSLKLLNIDGTLLKEFSLCGK